ncbi:MAG: helix-turn-helix domain-containing protein [Tenuifilaceae bacterium]|nr:helix-turn-helix domain-containing protein [Tenuifilaceae bacterium]
MENPFNQLDQRLSTIERTLKELNTRVKPEPQPQKFREGGLALAMEVCNYSKSSIYKLVMKNAIPHKKRGSRLWFSELELIQWLENGMPTDWERKQPFTKK